MLKVEIVTPQKKLYEGNASYVQVPGSKGSFGILSDHAPLISSLESGKVTVRDQDSKENIFEISGGVVEVLNNVVTILVS